MSDSFQPYGLQPARLLCPWDSPGKNGVGCHFLLQDLLRRYFIWKMYCRGWGVEDYSSVETTPTKAVSFSLVSQSCLTLCDPMDCSMPGFPVHYQLPELAQTPLHQVSDSIQSSHPLSSPYPPAFNHLSIRVFPNESVLCIRGPKYWSFSFSISSSNEYFGLISLRIGWLDLLGVQRMLKSSPHHSSKASVLQCSTFCMVQLSHPYMTTGKNRTLTRQTFVGKIMSLFLNMLSWS